VTTTHRLLTISGSMRTGSTNAAALAAARGCVPPGMIAEAYTGMADLPHFNPDDDGESVPAAVADLRARIHGVDAVVFSVPEYAGALPGTFKNLLDWTVGDGCLYRKPVAWINVSTTSGAVHAHASLRIVLGYTGADVVEDACVHLPVPRQAVTPAGTVEDPEILAGLRSALTVLATHLDALARATDPDEQVEAQPS
jgi:NAD(P)H-dependent FMN reductase